MTAVHIKLKSVRFTLSRCNRSTAAAISGIVRAPQVSGVKTALHEPNKRGAWKQVFGASLNKLYQSMLAPSPGRGDDDLAPRRANHTGRDDVGKPITATAVERREK